MIEHKIMYSPSAETVEMSVMTRYQRWLNEQGVPGAMDYASLHLWSVQHPNKFWQSLINFFNIRYDGNLDPAYKVLEFVDYPWFPNVKLNFAENLLQNAEHNGAATALHFFHESNLERTMSYADLKKETIAIQTFLKPLLREGDVVAAYMPNIAQAVTTMLATTALGATYTSTSCDFGFNGVVDRFSQSRPRVLVMAAGYEYNGKYFDLTHKIFDLKEALPTVEKIIVVDFLKKVEKKDLFTKAKFIHWWDDLVGQTNSQELIFVKVPFSHPLYIMYSSGTTGKPKCIIHSVGGTLLQHLKELALHCNVKQQTKMFYFTTCGWMMWNWQITALALGAEVFLYDGSPAHPSISDFMQKIDSLGIEIWGTSPKYLRALETSHWNNENKFGNLKSIISTGSPLLPEQFDYVYEKFGNQVQLSSICGGTDIISCFMLGNPNLPVIRGEIQCLGLGMNVASFDNEGKEIWDKEGELVCRTPFVSQPLGFLNDCFDEKYKESYFNKFPGVWHHGDFVSLSRQGGVRVFGRSDSTLNPGGVRIGTGEIYRQTERVDWIEDSICVAKDDGKGDVEIVLFIKPHSHIKNISDEMIKEVKQLIRIHTTARHVPRWILAVKDIPYTRSGKKMELAIARLLNGREITNIEAISNPECLSQYQELIEKMDRA